MNLPTVMHKEELSINLLNLSKGAMILRAINHQLRQRMLGVIHAQKKITVTELYIKLRIEQSVASQHLAILRRTGFVTTKREGKFIYYFVNYERLRYVQQLVQGIL